MAHINLLRKLSCLSRSTINTITKTVEHKNAGRESGKLGMVERFFCVVFSASRTDLLQPILISNPVLRRPFDGPTCVLLKWVKGNLLVIMMFPYSGYKRAAERPADAPLYIRLIRGFGLGESYSTKSGQEGTLTDWS